MIYIGADHRGFELKKKIIEWLTSQKYEVSDCGNVKYEKEDDYADFALEVGEKVSFDLDGRGIVICGGGAGVTFTANKVSMIRCVQGFAVDQIKNARSDDDINVLALGSDIHTFDQVKEFIEVFLNTAYTGAIRHDRRIQKVLIYEQSRSGGGGCCGGGGCGDGGRCGCGH